jgi:hypothetical protein
MRLNSMGLDGGLRAGGSACFHNTALTSVKPKYHSAINFVY